MTIPRRRDRPASSPQAIQRLAARGFALTYAVTVVVMAVSGALAVGAADPRIAAAAPTIQAVMAAVAAVLGTILILVIRRMRRHVRELEDDRSGLQHAYDRARLDSLLDGLTGLGQSSCVPGGARRRARRRRATIATSLALADDRHRRPQADQRPRRATSPATRSCGLPPRSCGRTSGARDRAFRIGGDEFAAPAPGAATPMSAEVDRESPAGLPR